MEEREVLFTVVDKTPRLVSNYGVRPPLSWENHKTTIKTRGP